MAKRKRIRDSKGPRGRRGERGVTGQRGARGEQGERGEQGARGLQGERGQQGERGERGESTSLMAVARMAQELEVAQRELRVQFTRIAQLQADLDSLRSELKSRT